jgi:N-acetylneuraminic acid mutarotase
VNLLPALFLAVVALPALAADLRITWSDLPPLPPAPGKKIQPGVAGPFVGVSNGALIVAGGANFPDAPPWEGGAKTWWDTIFVLKSADAGWLTGELFRLPRPLAYGQSFTTPHGLVCAGGCDEKRGYADAFLLRWDAAAQKVETLPLPPLPEPLCFAGGGGSAGQLYVVGGQRTTDKPESTRHAYVLDFRAGPHAGLAWQRLPDLPGVDRILPVCFGISGGAKPGLYLFGGRRQTAEGLPEVPQDAFRYDPAAGRWAELGRLNRGLVAGTAVPYGAASALILGGDTGETFLKKEALSAKIRALEPRAAIDAHAAAELSRVRAEDKSLFEKHRGFSSKTFVYDSETDQWSETDPLPEWAAVTTAAAWWNDRIVLPSGEIRPGIRTPRVLAGQVEPK